MLAPEASQSRRAPAFAVAALLLLAVLLMAFRIAGPSDLYDNDQPSPVAHSVDVAVNGHWLLQRDMLGDFATKPPLYPWLAAIGIRPTGRFEEWTFKLPSLAAAAVTCGVVFLIARRYAGVVGACAASAMWLANAHVFKLMYTARTDMLLAMWMSVAVLAALRMRDRWASDTSLGAPHALWAAVFWVAILGGLFTKGPAGLIPVVFLVGLIAAHGAWAQAWQAVPLALVVAIFGGWFAAAVAAYPEWRATYEHETSRMVGLGATLGELKPWRIPLYFVARWLPRSFAFLVAAAVGHAFRHRLTDARWTVAWVALVIASYMFQAGGRGDYVLPAYIGGAVLIVAVIALDPRFAERRYLTLIGACFVVAAGVVLYNARIIRAAREPDGRAIFEVVRVAREAAAEHGLPIVVHEAGYTPVQALLGRNGDEPLPTGPAVVITSARRVPPAARELYRTPPLAESSNTLVVLRLPGASAP